METVAVFSKVRRRVKIYNGRDDGTVDHALFSLQVVCFVACHMVVPLVKCWGVIAEVAVLLFMSGCANLVDLGNNIVVAVVGDKCLRLCYCQKIPLFSQLLLPIGLVGDLTILFSC